MTVLTYSKPRPRPKVRPVTQAEQLQALAEMEKEWKQATKGQTRPAVNLALLFADVRDIIRGVRYE